MEEADRRNTPYHCLEQGSWFLSFHCCDTSLKLTFCQGAQFEPPPRHTSRYPAVRHHPSHEGEEPGEHFAAWVRQAAALPGEKLQARAPPVGTPGPARSYSGG